MKLYIFRESKQWISHNEINLTAVDLQISRWNPEISRRSVSETYVISMINWKPSCSGCDGISTIDVRFRTQKNKGSPKLRFGSPCEINTAKVSWKKKTSLICHKRNIFKEDYRSNLAIFLQSSLPLRASHVSHFGRFAFIRTSDSVWSTIWAVNVHSYVRFGTHPFCKNQQNLHE